ncbi:hypothetical protein KSS87_019216 [Heliosperma pusillum]|nr:hypothetical protein KSS87_019216 [Heliosperma pusillum]
MRILLKQQGLRMSFTRKSTNPITAEMDVLEDKYVCVIVRFVFDPGKEHWQTLKRIFWYLKGTSGVILAKSVPYSKFQQCLDLLKFGST